MCYERALERCVGFFGSGTASAFSSHVLDSVMHYESGAFMFLLLEFMVGCRNLIFSPKNQKLRDLVRVETLKFV
jgi:hypothetical protein